MISPIFMRPRPLGYKLIFSKDSSFTNLTATQLVLEAAGWHLPFPGRYKVTAIGAGGGGGGYGVVQRPQKGEQGASGSIANGMVFLRQSIRMARGRGGNGGGYNSYPPGGTGGPTGFDSVNGVGGNGGRSGQQLAAQNVPEGSYQTSDNSYLPGGGGGGGSYAGWGGDAGANGQVSLELIA
ncbi:hypothetical protein D9M70_514570 [compost metagenome]